jgi:uncharacterized membrane protein YkvA (DUF1232 family)
MKSLVESFYSWYSNTIRNTKYRWVIILGTLVYLISPIDISPDFLPIVGWLDDGVISTLLVTELSRMLFEYRDRRKGTKIDLDKDPVATSTVVDVKVN